MNQDQDRWRFKKEVSVPDIVSFLAAALAVVYAYTTLDKRVTVLEAQTIAQRDTDRKQDEDHFRALGRIDGELHRMNNKLDKIIENGAQQKR